MYHLATNSGNVLTPDNPILQAGDTPDDAPLACRDKGVKGWPMKKKDAKRCAARVSPSECGKMYFTSKAKVAYKGSGLYCEKPLGHKGPHQSGPLLWRARK